MKPQINLEVLAETIERHAMKSGDFPTALPALSLHRRNSPTEPLPCIYSLGIGVTVQGQKQLLVADTVIESSPGQSTLTSVDLPLISHVNRATTREPFLGLLLTLDARALRQTASDMQLPPINKSNSFDTIYVRDLDEALLDALTRLVKLLDEPHLVPNLAPLIQQEINVRLLSGPYSSQLQRLFLNDTPLQQIAKVVNWMKLNFTEALRMDDLADRANMSPSTFRQHFRSITGTSPLQFQKQLRLQEARQLMLNKNYDAGEVSGIVGYESASQFSREYSRLFGAPPQKDIQKLRSS